MKSQSQGKADAQPEGFQSDKGSVSDEIDFRKVVDLAFDKDDLRQASAYEKRSPAQELYHLHKTNEKNSQTQATLADEGIRVSAIGPIDFSPAYQLDTPPYTAIFGFFYFCNLITAAYSIVVGKVARDAVNDGDWDEYYFGFFGQMVKNGFGESQADVTSIIILVSSSLTFLTTFCDIYCSCVLAIGVPFFAWGDSSPKIAWRCASKASKIMQVICYSALIPRVGLALTCLVLIIKYHPFYDPVDMTGSTEIKAALCIGIINLSLAPFLSLLIYLAFYLPVTPSRRMKRDERVGRGERTFVYDLSEIQTENPLLHYQLTTGDPSPATSSSQEGRFIDIIRRGRRRRRRSDQGESRDTNPIATRPINIYRDLMQVDLAEVVAENGVSVVGPCSVEQLNFIPLVLYVAMDESKEEEIGTVNQNDKSFGLLGIEPLQEIDLFSHSTSTNQVNDWLDEVPEDDQEVDSIQEDDSGENPTTSKLSKTERAQLRIIGMSKKGKKKARNQNEKKKEKEKEKEKEEGKEAIKASSSNLIVPGAASTSTEDGFRLRLRPRPPNSHLKYPILELPENQATCTICLNDFESLDPALLTDDPARSRSRSKWSKKEAESVEPLRLLPCKHTYHKSCIDDWLTKTSARCCVCQERVFPKLRNPQ